MNKRRVVLGTTTAALTSLLLAAMSSLLLYTGSLTAQTSGKAQQEYCHHKRHGAHAAGYGKHDEFKMMRVLSKLDLSEAQQQELQALMEQKREMFKSQKEAQREARKALHDAMIAEPYDAAQVHQLAEAQGKAVTARILMRAQTQQEIHALLTPEQRTELATLRENRSFRNKAQ